MLDKDDFDFRRFQMRRHLGVAVVRIDRNPGHLDRSIVFGKRHADTLHDAAFDLAFRRQPIEDRAAVMRRDVSGDAHMTRPSVDFDLGEVELKSTLPSISLGKFGLVVARPMKSPLSFTICSKRRLLRRIGL